MLEIRFSRQYPPISRYHDNRARYDKTDRGKSTIIGKTARTAVFHDPANHRVHYQLIYGNSSSLYEIEMREESPGRTACLLDLRYGAANAEGAHIAGVRGPEKIGFMITVLPAMPKHYAERGEMLGSSSPVKVRGAG